MDDAERTALRAKYERATPTLPWRGFSGKSLSPKTELVLVCFVVLLGLLFSLRMPLQRSDDFYKVVGAMSIASGQGYCDISRPDAPFLTKYPPLASLIMAPFIGLVGDFLRPLRLLSIFSYLASLPFVYTLLRPRAGHRGALALLLLAGLSPLTLRGVNFEGNVGVMILLVVGVVFRLERACVRSELSQALALSLLLTLFFYTHRIGIVLAVGVVLYLFVVQRNRRLAALMGGMTLLLVFPWLWRSYQISGHWISPEYELELAGRSHEGASLGAQGPFALLQHMLSELGAFPSAMGYGLFPWSHASGGQFWPILVRLHLTWVAVLGEWALTGLLVLGWGSALRSARRFSDLYLILHTLMLSAFFMGFQYFHFFLPWLYLYVAQGAQLLLTRLPALQRSRLLLAGLSMILMVNLAKDAKAFWLYRGTWQDRDLRWAWVARFVPEKEAVYYQGLPNYAFSQLRFFDSRRMAVGLTEEEIDKVLSDPASPVHWLCLSKTSPWIRELEAKGWQPVVAEPDFSLPSVDQLSGLELSKAQATYLEMMEPPQSLWHRP